MNISHARFAHTAMSIRAQINATQREIPLLYATNQDAAVNPTVGNEFISNLADTLAKALDQIEELIESL